MVPLPMKYAYLSLKFKKNNMIREAARKKYGTTIMRGGGADADHQKLSLFLNFLNHLRKM